MNFCCQFLLLLCIILVIPLHSIFSRRSSLDADSMYTRNKQHSVPGVTNENKKPNIILFLTDDQDVELGSLNFMKKALKYLRNDGAEFRHAYTTTPMCCPSRSSLLTGLYMHNHHVFTNNDNCSSAEWQSSHEPRSFATYLSNSGYRTGYFGKYLNKYNGSHIPPGWREWGALIRNSRYYNYSVNMNGRKIKHGDDYYRDYYPDLITNDSVRFLRQSKQSFSKKPIMLVLSFPAPHGPEDSAPQYSNMFFNVTSHHTPAYDFAPNPDKQWILQFTRKMLPIHKQFTDLLMTKRLQTLQSVDHAVERIVRELKELGELNNTYIIYTSDHGYHLGQFGLIKGKSFPFEFDIRVPFLMRGPGIVPGTIIDDLVLNIDIAPTILDLAGIQAPPHMDGRSMLKLLFRRKYNKRHDWPDSFLVESSGRRDTPKKPELQKTQSENKSQVENNTSQHLFSTKDVPFNLEDDTQQENHLSQILSKANRIFIECQKPEFQSPCKSGQKWHCTFDGVRWRKHKCKLRSLNILDNNLCACFNSDGVIYTYDPHHMSNQRVARDFSSVISNRPKIFRSLPNDKTLEDILQIAKKNPPKHNKRQSSMRSGFSELKDSVLSQIAVLQIYYKGMNAKCTVTKQNVVSCTNEMYSNPNLWRVSKNKVQKQIRKLMIRISQLKEIEKHLDLNEAHPPDTQQNSTSTPNINQDVPKNDTDDLTESGKRHRHRHENLTKVYDIDTNRLLEQNMFVNITRNEHRHAENRYHNLLSDTCYCSHNGMLSSKEQKAIEKQRLKEERRRRKERKLKKKQKMEPECFSERMNCFNHDNEHWRTAPLWTEGPFCFCMNSNNNSYSCLRTINATHNFLYCEFITGFSTYYNLRIDPFQQVNRAYSLGEHEKNWLHISLNNLKSCKGSVQCHLGLSSLPKQPLISHSNDTCVNCNSNHKRNRPKQSPVVRTFS